MVLQHKRAEDKKLTPDLIKKGFEKLFSHKGRGVRRFRHSGLRHVKLTDGAELIEQNPKKDSLWAELAHRGHQIAWVIKDGKYLARVIDGEVKMLDQ